LTGWNLHLTMKQLHRLNQPILLNGIYTDTYPENISSTRRIKEFCMLPFLFLPFLLAYALAHGKGAPYESYGILRGIYACNYQMRNLGSFCTPEQSEVYYSYGCGCINIDYLATFVGCLHIGNRDNDATLDKLIELCHHDFNVTISRENFLKAYDRYLDAAKSPSEIEGFNITIPVDVPLKINETVALTYTRAYDNFLGNYDDSLYYGVGILAYWAFVMLVASIANWSMIICPSLVQKCTGPFSTYWRKYITLPALARRNKTNEQKFLWFLDFIVPSRFETLVLLGFVGVTVAGCSAGIQWFEEDPVFTKRYAAMCRYVADRTGIVVSVYMPIVILFAGRNNFLQYLTHWSFATFITYHRWVARVAFILVFIHAVCFSLTFEEYFSYYYHQNYIIWGAIATVAGGLIMFQGLLVLRRKWYEVFLIIHIILAAFFIGGSWIHVDELGYVWFYYAASAVWIFDRVVRIVRLIAFGCPSSQVILLADETLKVIVPKPKYWNAVPGGHAFIHFLRPSCFWQSHPFTFTESSESSDSIVLYCKVKGGITHGLYQYLSKHPGQTTQIRVSLEGPYGGPTPSSKYDTAVFVAGGNGIPGIYSEVFDLAVRSPDNTKQALKLVWIVREYKSLYWFYEELCALKNTRIQTTIYITNPDSHAHLDEFNKRFPLVEESESDSNSNKEEKETSLEEKSYNKIQESSDEALPSLSPEEDYQAKKKIIETIHSELAHVEFKVGRPCMEDLVVQETKESNGSVSFVTCGHPRMVDDLRYEVVKNLDKADGKRIEFFEQLQVWA
jgi:predicted ferric reductase